MNETRPKKNDAVVAREQPRPVPRKVKYTPQVDILEQADELVLFVDLPGVKANDVSVDFDRGELTVQGRRETMPRSGRGLLQEFDPGDYYRAFLISQDVAPDKITAELKNGVLVVHLPKAQEALPRRITVQEN